MRQPTISLVVVLCLVACQDADEHSSESQNGSAQGFESEPSDASDADASDCDGLTYKNTVKPFAEAYCIRCHTTQLVVNPGESAPLGLDDEPSWLEHGGHALELIKARAMPLLPPEPSMQEVEKLARWLGCEDAHRPHSH